MPDKKIYIIGFEEYVLLLGLIGIEGIVINKSEEFIGELEKLLNNPTIGMIIIALELNPDQLDYVFELKLNNESPFLYVLPDIFRPNVDKDDPFLNKIKKSIGKILL